MVKITSPEDISKELCHQIASQNVGWLRSLGDALGKKIVDELKTRIKIDVKVPIPGTGVVVSTKGDFVEEFIQMFKADDRNLETTITKFTALFEALEGLPTTMKPVILIGMVSRVC